MPAKHFPATSLPWIARTGEQGNPHWHLIEIMANNRHVAELTATNGPSMRDGAQNAAYIVHAANAYPKLVEAMRQSIYRGDVGSESANIITAILRELGEAD